MEVALPRTYCLPYPFCSEVSQVCCPDLSSLTHEGELLALRVSHHSICIPYGHVMPLLIFVRIIWIVKVYVLAIRSNYNSYTRSNASNPHVPIGHCRHPRPVAICSITYKLLSRCVEILYIDPRFYASLPCCRPSFYEWYDR